MLNAPENQALAPASYWHALYTRHQHEKPIARILANNGHEVFLPLYAATHRWQDRDKRLLLPLFPGYVFICGGLDRQIQILRTPGVFSIVGWTGHPAIIPHQQIEAVRQMVQGEGHVAPYPFLNCGDRVRVRSGALQGLEGTLARKKNLFRLVVSLEMLGRSAAVEIDICCIERLGPSPLIAVSHRAPVC
jgi:transcription termination/antitermination protein NusG